MGDAKAEGSVGKPNESGSSSPTGTLKRGLI